MAIVSDGSRICDASRVALAAINADLTLTDNAQPVIYCCGVHGTAVGDRVRTLGAGTFTLHWRRAAGTFAAITDTSEVRLTTGTSLSFGTAVTATTARCSETAVFIEGGVEVDSDAGTSSTTTPSIELRDVESLEWQFAISFEFALVGQAYDFRGVVVHDGGTANLDYLTTITTAGASISLAQEGHRWRNDDGTEATATFTAAQDANVTFPALTAKRLRFVIDATGDPGSKQFQVEYRKVGDPGWTKVT